ncbi:MAG: hypothetical protein JSS44_14040 [Proteobacteria bacterium]|nr:hypothetical protein [Pseudomonadota bacterium]
MRKLDAFAILFLVLSLARAEKAEAESPDPPGFAGVDVVHGKTPDKKAKNWIMLVTLTPRNSPPPIFLISPITIDVEYPQILIQLSKNQYASFARYTRAYRCQQTSGDYLPSEFLEATEHANGKTRVLCRMSQSAACRYLTGIRAIHAIGWMEQKWEALRYVSVSVNFGCK